MIARLGCLAALLLLPVAAHAQKTRLSRTDGTKLLELCTARNPGLVQGCEAYITGVADTAAVYQRAAGRPDGGVKLADTMCVPDAATGGQLRDTVVEWLRAHESDRNRPAGLIVFHVLHEAYPCR